MKRPGRGNGIIRQWRGPRTHAHSQSFHNSLGKVRVSSASGGVDVQIWSLIQSSFAHCPESAFACRLLSETVGWVVLNAVVYPLAGDNEVAQAVLFLASERASFMSGSHIIVDGGIMARGGWAGVA